MKKRKIRRKGRIKKDRVRKREGDRCVSRWKQGRRERKRAKEG